MRVDTATNAALGLRSSLSGSNYALTAAGAVGKFALSRFEENVMSRVEFFDEPEFNVGEDWWMEGSAIGNQIALKVWKDGEPEPAVPQFRWTDDTHTAGAIPLAGVIQNHMVSEPTKVDATFDNVTIRVLDPPALPPEFSDNEFADWGTSPLGLPGNLPLDVLGYVIDWPEHAAARDSRAVGTGHRGHQLRIAQHSIHQLRRGG